MPNETSAGVIVYRKANGSPKYLLLHYQEGHWDFPKGHVEVGEKLEEAALRETKEEADLDVILHVDFQEHFSYFYKNREGVVMNKTVYFFIGQAMEREVTLSDEHIGYAWLSYDNALKKVTFDSAREVLNKANEFLVQKRLKEF